MAGIGCFVADCTNPVIAQCGGYKDTCGVFHCHMHSFGSLCVKCGGRKAQEQKAEQLYRDYLDTSKTIKEAGTSVTLAAMMVILAAGQLLFFGSLPLLTGSAAVCLIYYGLRKDAKAKAKVQEIDREKTGFAQFYRNLKKAENDEQWNLLVGLAGSMVAGGVAGASKGLAESAGRFVEPAPGVTHEDLAKEIRDLEKRL